MADETLDREVEDLSFQELIEGLCATVAEPPWKGFIRPFGFLLMLFLFGFVVVADGNMGSFHVRDSYIPLIESIVITYILAYIGSRGIEKTTKILQNSNSARIIYSDELKRRLTERPESDFNRPLEEDENV